jgi:hypothetical protein
MNFARTRKIPLLAQCAACRWYRLIAEFCVNQAKFINPYIAKGVPDNAKANQHADVGV